MTLDEWRRRENLTYAALAARIGVAGKYPAQRVFKYCAHTRVPPRPVMRRIEEATAGAVRDADFPLPDASSSRKAA